MVVEVANTVKEEMGGRTRFRSISTG